MIPVVDATVVAPGGKSESANDPAADSGVLGGTEDFAGVIPGGKRSSTIDGWLDGFVRSRCDEGLSNEVGASKVAGDVVLPGGRRSAADGPGDVADVCFVVCDGVAAGGKKSLGVCARRAETLAADCLVDVLPSLLLVPVAAGGNIGSCGGPIVFLSDSLTVGVAGCAEAAVAALLFGVNPGG